MDLRIYDKFRAQFFSNLVANDSSDHMFSLSNYGSIMLCFS